MGLTEAFNVRFKFLESYRFEVLMFAVNALDARLTLVAFSAESSNKLIVAYGTVTRTTC